MTGRVRIIGGQWRGRKLRVAELPDLRPSGDRVRETLFNWLQAGIHGRRCLDLFSGTGALGLEAASRGAAEVVMVERERALVARLREIADNWPGGDVLRPVQADVMTWLADADGPFDIVFADPPFAAGIEADLMMKLSRPGLLHPDSRVYLESRHDLHPPVGDSNAGPDRWSTVREKRIGDVRMLLVQPAPGGS